MTIWKSFKYRFHQFFTAPISVVPLGLFRILIAAFILLQAFIWHSDWDDFFGQEGWLQWEITRAFNQGWHLHMETVYNLIGQPLGLNNLQFVEGFFWVYVLSATGLLLGWFTRFWGFMTWLCHYIMLSSLPVFTYGVDIFLQIALFYLIFFPSGKIWSLDKYFGRTNALPTWGSTLAIRMLQIHMCLSYFSAGHEKMLYKVWWSGDVLWRSMIQPDFRMFDPKYLEWPAWYPWIPMLLCWFTMLIETFYFAGMYMRKVRVFWLLSMIGLHAGIGMFLGLRLFGLIMILLSVSAFGYDAWQDVVAWYRKRQVKKVAQPQFEEQLAVG